MENNEAGQEVPWHEAYPAPQSEAAGISQSELLAMLEDGKEAGKDFVLVDLRRNDHAVGEAQADECGWLTAHFPGRYDRRLDKSACAEFVFLYPGLVQAVQGCRNFQSYMVLRYVT